MVNEIAQKVTEEIIKNASKIYETIRGSYTVYPPEMVVYCPENLQKYSIAFEAKGGIVPKKNSISIWCSKTDKTKTTKKS